MTDRETADRIAEDLATGLNALVGRVVEETVGKVNGVFDEALSALRASHAREHALVSTMAMLAEHVGQHPEMRAVEIARWICEVLRDHLEKAQAAAG
jgi:hypothetical protein